ncbi:MAG TPA: hypothetical protein VMI06_01365 [Terriglobia bacterium]|nr:hypothetical protein [Terriglobia bacterium]
MAPAKPSTTSERKNDAIYQRGEIVAQVVDPQVDIDAQQVCFAELSNSDALLLPDECEFQAYRIIVRQIGYATKEDKQFLHKGRILRDVTAKILGYREQ